MARPGSSRADGVEGGTIKAGDHTESQAVTLTVPSLKWRSGEGTKARLEMLEAGAKKTFQHRDDGRFTDTNRLEG